MCDDFAGVDYEIILKLLSMVDAQAVMACVLLIDLK